MAHVAFFKRVSANDLGLTGGHQSGVLIPKECAERFFPKLPPSHSGVSRMKVTLSFKDDPADYPCNFIYYMSKDEYRLTLIPWQHFRGRRPGDLMIFSPVPGSKSSFRVQLVGKGDNAIAEFTSRIIEDKGAWGQLKLEELREAIVEEMEVEIKDSGDELPQLVGEQQSRRWEKQHSEAELEQIVAEFDSGLRKASPEVKTRAIRRVERNYSLARVIKEQRGYACQLCGHTIRKAAGGFYIETHHLETLAEGGLDFSKNIIVACPNCHKTMHFGEVEKLHHDEKRVVLRVNDKIYTIPLESTPGDWLATQVPYQS